MKLLTAIVVLIPIIFLLKRLLERKITLGIWSIKVFNSETFISNPLQQETFNVLTLQASDVTDVPAEFIADPFIITNGGSFYLFFEILDKSSGKGIIGLATSPDGEQWEYDRVILREDFHLSYPYVFEFNKEYYMIPESSEANNVILYKARNFPYEWEKVNSLVEGRYVDSSIFHYENRWWMFAAKSGKLHLFFSDTLEKNWEEHPKSPLIINNYHVTRPGGRVIVDDNHIYRYTQDGRPHYGSAVRLFKITKLTQTEYEEELISVVLTGSKKDMDWNKDGMHTIDQLKLSDKKWVIAVDGHKLENKSYLVWKLDRIWAKYLWGKGNKAFIAAKTGNS